MRQTIPLRPHAATLAALAAILWPGAAAGAEIRVAGAADPAVQRALDAAAAPTTVAIGPAPGQVAFSAPDPEQANRSVVLLHAAEGVEPSRVVLPGMVRALLFDPRGTGLFAIRFDPAKKRVGDAELVRIEVATGKARGVMRLPASAAALDLWTARESLVVAGENEIRTVRLAGLRSGPLFRLPGPNSAVACLAASDVVLVAQGDELLLVDLSDPPGEEAMPVRARIRAAAPVAGLAADPEGTSALARLTDGSVFRVTFEPLALEAAGSAEAVVAAGKSSRSDPVALPEPAPAEPPAEAAAVAAAVPAVPEPASTPPAGSSAPQSAPPPADPVPASPAPEAPSAPPEAQSAPPEVPSDFPAAPSPESVPPPGESQVWGAIEGPARDAVVEVVLLGPDNVLREALRVRPADGIWRADGLEPGRYQVQLAAGGNLVLVSEPRVVLIEIAAGGSVRAETFRVLRTHEP